MPSGACWVAPGTWPYLLRIGRRQKFGTPRKPRPSAPFPEHVNGSGHSQIFDYKKYASKKSGLFAPFPVISRSIESRFKANSVEKLGFGPHHGDTLDPQRSELSSFPGSLSAAVLIRGFTPLSSPSLLRLASTTSPFVEGFVRWRPSRTRPVRHSDLVVAGDQASESA